MKSNGFDFDDYTSLGSILIRAGELTRKQLERCLKAQGNGHAGTRLGDLVIEFGFCTREAVIAAVEHQQSVRPQPAKSDEALQRLWAAADSADQASSKLQKTTTQKIRIMDISTGDE